MKALVIGGTGFIGRRLVHTLLGEGADVTLASRGKTPSPFGDKVKSIVLDRFDESSLKSKVPQGDYYDVVFDQVGFGPDDMAATISALDGKIGHYVYTSSMSVYETPKMETVESDFDPMSYDMKEGGIGSLGYNEGKRSAEAFLFRNSPVPAVAARFPIVIGPDDVTGRVQFHIGRILEGKEIVIPDPCGKMNYVWVEDAGRFLAWLGLNGKRGYYNAASRETADANEMVRIMADSINKTAVIAREGRKENISPYHTEKDRTVSVEKAESEGFEFTPMEKWLPDVAKKTVESKGEQLNTMDYLQDKLFR